MASIYGVFRCALSTRVKVLWCVTPCSLLRDVQCFGCGSFVAPRELDQKA